MNIKDVRKVCKELDLDTSFKTILKNCDVVQCDNEFYLIQDNEIKKIITIDYNDDLKVLTPKQWKKEIEDFIEMKELL